MSVDQPAVVDLVSIDPNSDEVVLTVSDHLEWDGNHLLVLQEKINTYLSFVESGQIYFSYPLAKGRKISIEVVCKYAPDEHGLSFFRIAEPIISSAGMRLRYRQL